MGCRGCGLGELFGFAWRCGAGSSTQLSGLLALGGWLWHITWTMPRLVNSLAAKRKAPQQERSRATVEAIVEAAGQVLTSTGYGRLTTTRVAARAGVSVGTLYQYFGHKDDLIRALGRKKDATFMQAFTATMGQAQAGGGSLALQVQALMSTLLVEKAKEGQLGVAVLDALLEIDGPAAHAHLLESSRGLVVKLLAPHAALLPEDDTERVAETLVYAIDGVVSRWVSRGRGAGALACSENVATLTRLALGCLGV